MKGSSIIDEGDTWNKAVYFIYFCFVVTAKWPWPLFGRVSFLKNGKRGQKNAILKAKNLFVCLLFSRWGNKLFFFAPVNLFIPFSLCASLAIGDERLESAGNVRRFADDERSRLLFAAFLLDDALSSLFQTVFKQTTKTNI